MNVAPIKVVHPGTPLSSWGCTPGASQPDHVQTHTWLEENGQCVNHIAPGISNIPSAGRGAFAKCKLHKGQVVTASPMIHSPQTKQSHSDA